MAEFKFRDRVRLGTRGRHFAIDVTGGLGGLVVDLRDVPLRLPDRADLRGELLESWQTSVVSREGGVTASDVRLVPARRLVVAPVDAVFALAPGDRPLVSAGDSVVVGAPIAERLRDPRLEELDPPEVAPRPGDRWIEPPRRGDEAGSGGEYVFLWHDRWRVALGDVSDTLESPFAGIVREVRPGVGITIRAAGRGIRGIVALGAPTRGRLQPGPEGELRSGGLDVGAAGTILVVGSRVDAETLTRARAMGVRGIVVAGLSSKERRDFLASEARQHAALHRLPSFAVLVLDGAVRRPLAGAVQAVLAALAGHEVAIVTDPPMLVFDLPEPRHPGPAGGPGPDPGRVAGRPRGTVHRGDRPAPVRRRRPARGRAGPAARRDERRGPARRPRALRLAPGGRTATPSATLGPMPAATDLERQLVCPDPAATSALGRALATAAGPGDLICLWGDLGAGKTHLAKAFGAGPRRRPTRSPRRASS